MTDLTITKERSEVMTFSHPLRYMWDNLLIQNPSGIYNHMAYFKPMRYTTWLCVGLFCLLTPIILFLSNQYVSIKCSNHISVLNSVSKYHYYSSYGERDSTNLEFTFGKSAVFVLSSLTMRGWSDTPIAAAARMAFIV